MDFSVKTCLAAHSNEFPRQRFDSKSTIVVFLALDKVASSIPFAAIDFKADIALDATELTSVSFPLT